MPKTSSGTSDLRRAQGRAAPSHATLRTSKRARGIIDAMLKEMQKGLREPELLASKEWEQLFGAKQSVVVNLQKLVQTLAVLPEQAMVATVETVETPVPVPISSQEMELLTAWLADTTER